MLIFIPHNLKIKMEHKIVNYNTNLCSNISNKLHKQLLKLALRTLNQHELDITDDTLEKFKTDNNITNEQFYDLTGMYVSIISLFMRCSKKEEFEETLTNHGYPEMFIENLPLKYENRDSILSFTKNGDPAINNLNYRIDLSLQSKIPNKIILPSVIFSLKYGGDKDVTFSADHSTFHKLRYNVALMVKELNTLKSTSIMKKQ